MSTSFYPLREPITQLDLESDVFMELRVWTKDWPHIGTGNFSFRNEETQRRFLRMFADTDVDKPAMRTTWGGSERGTVVHDEAHLPDDTQLISEYGELVTVSKVLARAGAKRADGTPTELFGYEEKA